MATSATVPAAPAAAPSAPAASPSPATTTSTDSTAAGSAAVAAGAGSGTSAGTGAGAAAEQGQGGAAAEPDAPIAQNAGEGDVEYIQRVVKEKTARAEAAAAAQPAAPKVETKPAAPAATGTEEKPGTETKPDAAAAPAANDDAEKQFEETISLDDLGVLSPDALNTLLTSDKGKAVKDALEAAPEIRDQLFKATRQLHGLAEIQQIFPNKQAAEFARDQLDVLSGFRENFIQLNSDKGQDALNNLVNTLVMESAIIGEDGKPVIDAGGQMRTDGTFEKFADGIFDIGLNGLKSLAEGSDNAALKAAIATIEEARKSGPSPADASMTEEQRKTKAAQDQREESLRQRENTGRRERYDQQEKELSTSANSTLDSRITKVLEKLNVPDFNRETATAKIKAGVLESLEKDKVFKAQRNYLASQPQTEAIRKQRLELLTTAFNTYIMHVARPILKSAGASVVESQQKREAKTADQIQQSKNEPRGAAAAAMPPAEESHGDQLLAFRAEYKKTHNGDLPDDLTEMQFLRKLKTGR